MRERLHRVGVRAIFVILGVTCFQRLDSMFAMLESHDLRPASRRDRAFMRFGLIAPFVLLAAPWVCGQTMTERQPAEERHVLLFNQDVEQVKQSIIEKLSELKGVEALPVTTRTAFQWKKIRYASSGVRKAPYDHADKIEETGIKVTWTPPAIAPQKISAGGPNMSTRASGIYVSVVNLKSNPGAVGVFVTREWIYHGTTHVPYTEIPLLPGNLSQAGGISADEAWVRSLGTVVAEISQVALLHGSELVDALERLPLKMQETVPVK